MWHSSCTISRLARIMPNFGILFAWHSFCARIMPCKNHAIKNGHKKTRPFLSGFESGLIFYGIPTWRKSKDGKESKFQHLPGMKPQNQKRVFVPHNQIMLTHFFFSAKWTDTRGRIHVFTWFEFYHFIFWKNGGKFPSRQVEGLGFN